MFSMYYSIHVQIFVYGILPVLKIITRITIVNVPLLCTVYCLIQNLIFDHSDFLDVRRQNEILNIDYIPRFETPSCTAALHRRLIPMIHIPQIS